jgi:hypothetical protein
MSILIRNRRLIISIPSRQKDKLRRRSDIMAGVDDPTVVLLLESGFINRYP